MIKVGSLLTTYHSRQLRWVNAGVAATQKHFSATISTKRVDGQHNNVSIPVILASHVGKTPVCVCVCVRVQGG